MSKNNNMIRKEVWLTKQEFEQLNKECQSKGIHPKRMLEFYVALGLNDAGYATMQDRVNVAMFSGSKKGARKSPILNPKKKKLRKVKGVLVHAKGSTEKEGQTVMPLS